VPARRLGVRCLRAALGLPPEGSPGDEVEGQVDRREGVMGLRKDTGWATVSAAGQTLWGSGGVEPAAYRRAVRQPKKEETREERSEAPRRKGRRWRRTEGGGECSGGAGAQ